jgi:hypothetical protein
MLYSATSTSNQQGEYMNCPACVRLQDWELVLTLVMPSPINVASDR